MVVIIVVVVVVVVLLLMMRVLLLGEGNFSFTLALCQRIASSSSSSPSSSSTMIVASSYDTIDSIMSKYKESSHIMKELARHHPNAILVHGIDATTDNMIVVDEVTFSPLDWPGYQLRRHHVGKSFQNRVDCCRHYTIVPVNAINTIDQCQCLTQCNCSDVTSTPNLFRLLPSTTTTTTSIIGKDDTICLNNETSSSGGGGGGDNTSSKSTKKTKTKTKRKLDRLLADDFSLIKDDSDRYQWQCNKCQRCFASEQGIKTHINQVHVLEITGPARHEVQCSICGKTCSNDDALFQHNKAKHASQNDDQNGNSEVSSHSNVATTDTVTDAVTVTTTTTTTEGDVECIICGLKFVNEDSLRQHMGYYKPVDSDMQLQCPKCGKLCRNQRGLQQHRSFCQ